MVSLKIHWNSPSCSVSLWEKRQRSKLIVNSLLNTIKQVLGTFRKCRHHFFLSVLAEIYRSLPFEDEKKLFDICSEENSRILLEKFVENNVSIPTEDLRVFIELFSSQKRESGASNTEKFEFSFQSQQKKNVEFQIVSSIGTNFERLFFRSLKMDFSPKKIFDVGSKFSTKNTTERSTMKSSTNKNRFVLFETEILLEKIRKTLKSPRETFSFLFIIHRWFGSPGTFCFY